MLKLLLKFCLGSIILFIYSVESACTTNTRITEIVSDVLKGNITSTLEPLQGGLSSPGVYKFVNDNTTYVLRLSHPNMSIFERERIIKCHKLADKRGIAPVIKYVNVNNGIIISEYISGHYVSNKDLLDKKILKKLAKTVKKLHGIGGFPISKDVFAVRQSFEQTTLLLNSNIILNVSNHLKLIDASLKDNTILVATHNDLKPENILFDNKFMIIDWEAAGLGDPYFDLSTIFVFYNLSEESQYEFLATYYGRKPTAHEKIRVKLFKQEVLGYYGMAYLMLSVYKKLPQLSSKEINELPRLQDYLENKFLKNAVLNSYSEAQKLGWILIKEINYNILENHMYINEYINSFGRS